LPNEPVLDSKLAGSGEGAGLTATIPDGMRAVSVKVNDVIGVAGFVLPGSRVDVILSGSPNAEGKVEMSKVILENIQVLASGQNVATDDAGKPLNVQVVTLLVTPDQSQTIALAVIDGRIQLALRNPLDLEEVKPVAVRREALFVGGKTSPLAPPPAPSPAPKPRVATKAAAPAPVVTPAPVVEPPKPTPPPVPVVTKRVIQVINGSTSSERVFEQKQEAPAPAQQ
jgi:pilus assembly protein CpaB